MESSMTQTAQTVTPSAARTPTAEAAPQAATTDSRKAALRGHDYETQAKMLQPPDEAAPNLEPGDRKGGPMSKEAAVKILQDAFGGYRTMSGGALELLEPEAFKAAYEKVYGKTQYAWDKYVVPKFGGKLNGFAHKGVNYVNKASANVGTVPHEMLHNNTAADWTPVVGSEFNEGATDYLKQYALKKAGKSSPNSYAKQMEIVAIYVGLASEDDLFTAYLKGGAAKLVKAKVDAECGSWAEVKDAMQAKDYARAKVKLKRKA